MSEPPSSPPAPRHVVVCDVHGVAWRVLDFVPGVGGGPGAGWRLPPAPGATGRAFIAAIDGQKRVRVLDRHRTDPWEDLSLPTLRGQLDDAYPPSPGWLRRHAHPPRIRSNPIYRWPVGDDCRSHLLTGKRRLVHGPLLLLGIADRLREYGVQDAPAAA